MNFERGKDPKEAMGLGLVQKIQEHGKIILDKYAYEFPRQQVLEQIEWEFEQGAQYR